MEQQALELRGLRDSSGNLLRYDEDDIRIAATAFFMDGTFGDAAKRLKVKVSLLKRWAGHDVWVDTIRRLRSLQDEEMDHQLTSLMNLAFGELEDRLVNGEEVVTKDGFKVRKNIGARDAAWIAAVLVDKRKMNRERDAVSTAESVDDKLREIAAKLGKLADNQPTRRPERTIDAELVDEHSADGLV